MAAPTSSPSPFADLSILLVDDSEHMLDIVKTMLRAFGVGRVLSAPDGEAGLAVLKRTAVDVIIVDYQMQSLDGTAFVRKVRADATNPCREAPIIMLTAHAERYRVEEARDAGVTEFWRKPVTPVDLYRKLLSVTQTKRAFVRASSFAGPDRRRRSDAAPERPDRRAGGKSAEYVDAPRSTQERPPR